MDLSIVIPLHDEEASVVPLCGAITRAVVPLGYAFETLLVDDGSTDRTFDEALRVAGTDARFRIIKLSRHFGQTAALLAGFEQARGDVVVTMDGDLQNDPEDIGKLVRKLQEGYDLVAGWRQDRQDAWITRKIPSRAANWMVRKVTGTAIRDNGCGLRACRAEVVRKLPLYSEMHRLLPTIIALTGARIAEVEVRHHPRKFGASKYGLSRIFKLAFDLVALKVVMTLFRLPLFGFGILAISFAIPGVVAFVAGLTRLVLQPESSIVVPVGVVLLCGSMSVFLLTLGIICDLVYTTADLRVENLLKVEVL